MNKEIKIIRIVRLNSNQNQIQPILNCHYWKQMLNHCMNSHPTDKSIGSQWANHWNLKAVICACSVLGYLLQCSCLSPLATVGCFLLFPVSVTAQLQMVWEMSKLLSRQIMSSSPPQPYSKPVGYSLISDIWSSGLMA